MSYKIDFHTMCIFLSIYLLTLVTEIPTCYPICHKFLQFLELWQYCEYVTPNINTHIALNQLRKYTISKLPPPFSHITLGLYQTFQTNDLCSNFYTPICTIIFLHHLENRINYPIILNLLHQDLVIHIGNRLKSEKQYSLKITFKMYWTVSKCFLHENFFRSRQPVW